MFLPCPSSEDAAWGRGGQLQGPACRVSWSLLRHLSGGTTAHREHAPRSPSIHPSSGRHPERESPSVGTPFYCSRPASSRARLRFGSPPCREAPLGLGGTGVVVVGGCHSLDSRHVWGGHGADFFGFLKGVLLVKGLLFLLLILWRKEGSCLVGCWGFKGRCSHRRQ